MSLWQIREETSYESSAENAGGMEDVDAALANITYALHRNPIGFHKLHGTRSIYIAKTKLRITEVKIIPAYRLYFRVEFEERVVCKLWVEMCHPSDMLYGDTFNDQED
jgi:hypothetical protein